MALPLAATVRRLLGHGPLLYDASASRNVRVLAALVGPAFRGLVQRRGHDEDSTDLQPGGTAFFDWRYQRAHAEMSRLYESAKTGQWNGAADLNWKRHVDPYGQNKLLPDEFIPTSGLRVWRKLSK